MKPQVCHEFTGSRNTEGSWKQKPDLIFRPSCGCLLARPEQPQTSAGELPPGHPCQVPSSPLKSWIVTTFHEMELGNQSKTVWLKVILGNFWSKARSVFTRQIYFLNDVQLFLKDYLKCNSKKYPHWQQPPFLFTEKYHDIQFQNISITLQVSQPRKKMTKYLWSKV